MASHNAAAGSEQERLAKAGETINVFVWLVASVVMVFSAFTGANLLADHGVPWGLGLAGGLSVDAALVVALIGDRHLHRYGQRTRWGTALRWVTALMSLVLNCGQSAERGDWVAAGLHAIFPVLLIVLTEASQAYQLAFSRAVLKAHADTEYRQPPVSARVSAPVPKADTAASTQTARTAPVSRRRPANRPTSAAKRRPRPALPMGSGWEAEQWARAVELVESYQHRHGRAPKLGEFHSELRMSRNAASPLRNAVLAAVDKHGPDGAKTARPSTGEPSDTEPESPGTASDTDAQVVPLHATDTDPSDTATTDTDQAATGH